MKHIGRIFRAVDVFRITHGGETSAGLGLVQLLAHDDDGYGLSLIAGAGALRDVVDRLADGTIVVVEYGYFDADIRSEQKRLLDRLSSLPGFATPRLHFFKPETPLASLESWETGQPGPSLNDNYLGYIVVRQHAGGSVGRTMLSPEAFNEDLAARTRGSSTEEVDFYGRALTVTAVPFMEQDGLLVSCFHVCLWMAAYQMMLNGYLPRSTSGLVADVGTPSARYPTRGVPTDDAEDLGGELGFSVRQKALSSYTSQTEFERDVIHHLDSGLPIVMVAEVDPPLPDELAPRQLSNEPKRNDADHHSILICGYTRKPDRTIDRLIYHDDRYGPYLSAPVPGELPVCDQEGDARSDSAYEDDPLTRIPWGPETVLDGYRTGFFFLAPQGIWLSGIQAEVTAVDAAKAFREGVLKLLEEEPGDEEDDDLPDDELSEEEEAELAALLDGLAAYAELWGNLGEPFRAYAMLSVDYKRRYATLNPDEPEIYRHLWGQSLPRYVWVVEWFDEGAWKSSIQDEPCVRAEAVLDASSPEAEERVFWMRSGRLVASVSEDYGVPNGKWDQIWSWEIQPLSGGEGDATSPLLQRSCRRSCYEPFDEPPPLRHAMKGALRTGIS